MAGSGASKAALRVLMISCIILARTTAQLTAQEQRIRDQALSVATQLLYGGGRAAVPRGSTALLSYVADRQEQHLSKQASVQFWSSRLRNANRRLSFSRGLDGGVAQPVPIPRRVGRQSLTSSSTSGATPGAPSCTVSKATTYIGSDLPAGYLPTALSYAECCIICANRTGCAAWTYKPGGSHPGCYLHGQGYQVAHRYKSHVSGTYYRPRITGAPPSTSAPPSPSPPPAPLSAPLPPGKQKYGQVLSLCWAFYDAQRSGPKPSWSTVPWRGDSHLADPVVGGWYDAGDFLKLNFPLAPSVSMLAWGMLEFQLGYAAVGGLDAAKRNLRIAVDYLAGSYDRVAQTYVGQIGDPDVDHNYWGRPEQESTTRPAYTYNNTMAASDLLGGVAAALAAASRIYAGSNATYAAGLVQTAKALYDQGASKLGRYSDYYKEQTFSIYPSTDYEDSLAWAAYWLYNTTGDATYLAKAAGHWALGTPDVFPGWDSLWALTAVACVNLANRGTVVPGIAQYRDYVDNQLVKAWVGQNGYLDIVATPKGMAYPKWNEWGNLAMSTTAAMLLTLKAKYNPDAAGRAVELQFAQTQVDYAMGSSGRSFVVGWGNNPPAHVHHAAASCPDMPAPCGWPQFDSPKPNAHVLYGALVGGPQGVKANAANPDDTYTDVRNNYVTNEVANDYNAGLTSALAGLLQLLKS